MTNNGLLYGVLSDDIGLSDKIDNPFFTVTAKTIRFNHGDEVYPIHNLSRINKFKVKENKMPRIFMLFLGGLAVVSFILVSVHSIFLLLAVALSIGAVYGFLQRLKPGKYAFCIKTVSGERRYLFSTDESFISDVVQAVADVIENNDSKTIYNINMEKGEIKEGSINIEQFVDRSVTNSGVVGGSVTTGDTIK